MKRILTGAAVLGFSLLASGKIAAQEVVSRSPVQFGVMGGVTLPTGDFNDFVKTGWNAGALLNFGFANSPVNLRVDGSWNQMDYKCSLCNGEKLRLLDATADAVFDFGTKIRRSSTFSVVLACTTSRTPATTTISISRRAARRSSA
jgi:hypothetical protein